MCGINFCLVGQRRQSVLHRQLSNNNLPAMQPVNTGNPVCRPTSTESRVLSGLDSAATLLCL
jgi:hypothetical protein